VSTIFKMLTCVYVGFLVSMWQLLVGSTCKDDMENTSSSALGDNLCWGELSFHFSNNGIVVSTKRELMLGKSHCISPMTTSTIDLLLKNKESC
jgi:hypothetical protein